MVALTGLILPILLSAVLVFIASSIFHMALKYHHNDFGQLPDEDTLMEAFRNAKVSPGSYAMPCAGSPEAMKSPEFQAKVDKGPMVFMTVFDGGFAMGSSLVQWFIYSALVAFFSGYVASRTLAPGAEYLAVFRVVGTVAFMAYAMGLWQMSIWYKRPWSLTAKFTFDGLIYALLTAGAFGWLWP